MCFDEMYYEDQTKAAEEEKKPDVVAPEPPKAKEVREPEPTPQVTLV